MKNYLFFIFIILGMNFACSSDEDSIIDENPDIPTDVEDSTSDNASMPIQMWIDAHANLDRFGTKANITNYLKKLQEAGFNEVYLDVKPGIGYAMYDSDILPSLKKWGTITVDRDWDYLQFWLDESEKYGISVIASISVLGFGDTKTKQGVVFEDDTWNGKTQMAMKNNDPNNIVDIRDQPEPDGAMLNPCFPEVQDFVISIVEEIATKYPKIKGVCLDYCRWYGAEYGFGDATIAAFETYSGKTVASRNEVITATGGIGPLYKDWIEFRTMTITNLITNIRSKLKSIDPEKELHLWASADWGSRYSVGQNWASKEYIPTGSRYTTTYNKTGFADQLDVFSLGAYADAVWESENPGSVWSVQYFVTNYADYIKEDCKVYGSIAAYAYGTNSTAISDAIYLCLKNTEGVMVFDISHVVNSNQWEAIKTGINRVVN